MSGWYEMSDYTYSAVDGVALHVTERAVRIRFHEIDEAMWVPRSLIEGGDALMKGDDDIHIATWWVKQVGL